MTSILGVIAGMAVLAGAAALLIWAVVRLSGTKGFLPGLIPAVSVFLMTAVLSLWAFSEVSSYQDVKLSREIAGGNTLEMVVRVNGEGETVTVFEPEIYSPDGELLDRMAYWGEDSGDSEMIASLLEGSGLNNVGDYAVEAYEGENRKIGKWLYMGDTSIHVYSWMAGGFLLAGLLAVIYGFQRNRVVKKRRQQELKKIKIEAL